MSTCPVCNQEIELAAAIIGPYHAGCAPIRKICAAVPRALAACSICFACAKQKGGRAPDGPSAVTCWNAFCIGCGEPTSCTHVRDWRWPGNVRPTRETPVQSSKTPGPPTQR